MRFSLGFPSCCHHACLLIFLIVLRFDLILFKRLSSSRPAATSAATFIRSAALSKAVPFHCLNRIHWDWGVEFKMRLSHPVGVHLLLSLFAFFGRFLQISAVTTAQLGLKINDALARRGQYVYNAIVQFEDNIQTTWLASMSWNEKNANSDLRNRSNEQVAGLAAQGYNDMMVAIENDRRNTYHHLSKPGVVSVIVIGHTAYVSSSLCKSTLIRTFVPLAVEHLNALPAFDSTLLASSFA